MRFFVLKQMDRRSHTLARNATDVYPVDKREGEVERCPHCQGVVGMIPWLPPFRVELEPCGSGFPDVAEIYYRYLLISQRVADLIREHALRGLEDIAPVEIVRTKSRRKLRGEMPSYYVATVARSEVAFDQQASHFVWKDPNVCPVCEYDGGILAFSGLIVDPATWSGEDIFVAKPFLSDICVGERFRDLWVAQDLTGMLLLPSEEVSVDWRFPRSK